MKYRPISSFCAVAAALSLATFAHADSRKWREFLPEVKKELRSDTLAGKINAIEKFAAHDYAEAGDYLIKLAVRYRKEPGLSAAAGKVLGGFENKKTRDALRKYAEKSASSCIPLLRAYLAPADAETKAFALKALEKKSQKLSVTTVVVESLGNHSDLDVATVKKVAELMDEKNFHSIRRAAANTLGSVKVADAIPALIAQVQDLVIREEAQDALYRLTGQEYGKDKTSWKLWWDKNKDGFQVVGKSKEEAQERREKIIAEAAKAVEKKKDTESFYGAPLKGKNILFVLDRSGSMQTDDRIGKMKEELRYMILQIDEKRSFGFILFPHDTFPSTGISKATPVFKKRATSFVEKLTPQGNTPITEAMEHAFKKVVAKRNVDTIYLLSDGAPNKPPAEVRALISTLNSDYSVRIHCVSIGAPSEFLKDVAKDNNGDYWDK